MSDVSNLADEVAMIAVKAIISRYGFITMIANQIKRQQPLWLCE
jgi:hypothetical protein